MTAASSGATALYRPAGPQEWALVQGSCYRRWQAQLPEQSIFYPVSNEQYAIEIARDWNVPANGTGYVTRFFLPQDFMSRYDIHQVGATHHTKWWIPAEELEMLNDHILGLIDVIHEFH